jgi:hypothetical protein
MAPGGPSPPIAGELPMPASDRTRSLHERVSTEYLTALSVFAVGQSSRSGLIAAAVSAAAHKRRGEQPGRETPPLEP